MRTEIMASPTIIVGAYKSLSICIIDVDTCYSAGILPSNRFLDIRRSCQRCRDSLIVSRCYLVATVLRGKSPRAAPHCGTAPPLTVGRMPSNTFGGYSTMCFGRFPLCNSGYTNPLYPNLTSWKVVL